MNRYIEDGKVEYKTICLKKFDVELGHVSLIFCS